MQTVIAIDGPAASGKSTVAGRVAAKLGYLYVDSGALYRGVTLVALRNGVDVNDPGAVREILEACSFEFVAIGGAVRFRIGGVEPGEALRTREVNNGVSPVAAVPEVRTRVVAWLRDMLDFGNLVMEGRDIGTAVFPDTPFKFFLDACAGERARRRHKETPVADRKRPTVAEIGDSLKRRDTIDSTRETDPLKVAPGAIVIDSTNMSIEDVTAFVLKYCPAAD